jgi:hypothetical protein
MVEVFKTNVLLREQAVSLMQLLTENFPEAKINFDLADCDKILRIESETINHSAIKAIMNAQNYICEPLP